MTRFELVIVGGGLTAARAIGEYRAAGGEGRIALLAKEQALPYHRPPLSKRFLRGEAERHDTFVEPQEFYDDNGVELLLGVEAASLATRERTIATRDGSRYGYRRLLLATGALPRRLPVEGAELPGVFGLRSIEDSAAIREAAAATRDAVVVGSGSSAWRSPPR
jgi:3-phenylpropionate/trans-cinnamate dioxygenase ferredoxin reductase component